MILALYFLNDEDNAVAVTMRKALLSARCFKPFPRVMR